MAKPPSRRSSRHVHQLPWRGNRIEAWLFSCFRACGPGTICFFKFEDGWRRFETAAMEIRPLLAVARRHGPVAFGTTAHIQQARQSGVNGFMPWDTNKGGFFLIRAYRWM